MRLFTLALLALPAIAAAEPIITDVPKVESLYKKVRENQFYLKVGPAKFKIFYFEVGRAQTPFYESGSLVKRFYKKDDKCFELTVFGTANVARKVRCFDKSKDLFLPGLEEFKAVELNDLVAEGLTGFKKETVSASYELEAFVQPYDMYALDRAVYGAEFERIAPRRKFKVHLSGSEGAVLKKDKFEITQNLSLKVDKIGILSEKVEQTTNTIKPIAGGMIFSNSQGQVLIYNPVLPKPFGDYDLRLNPKLPDFLATLMESSKTAPVCFRDDYVRQGPKDCHRMIFLTHHLTSFTKSKIVKVDFVNQKIEFLK